MMTYFNSKLLNSISDIKGWYSIISLALGEDKAKELEEMDEAIMAISQEEEKNYWDNRKKIKQEIENFKSEFSFEWRSERANEYLETEIQKLTKEIIEIYQDYKTSAKSNCPYWLRRAIFEINNGPDKERCLKNLMIRKKIANYKNLNGITPEMIISAKEFPFGELIEVKRNMALCPFHPDKTSSFYVKNNFGYCFSCCWKGDVIDFVMQRDGCGFVEAVKRLSQYS